MAHSAALTAMGVVSALSAEALLVGWALGLLAAAALVLGSRARFQRWRALASGEEDETSVAGIRAAMRYLRASPLGRRMIASSLAMVLAVFVAQYLYSATRSRRPFPTRRDWRPFSRSISR